MRIAVLYGRSRLIGPAITAVVVMAATAGRIHDPAIIVMLPMLCAVVIVATLATPDQAWEQSLPFHRSIFRAIHVTGGVLLTGLILAVTWEASTEVGLRNVLGLGGLAALSAAAFGARRAWMAVVPYAMVADASSRLDWFTQPSGDHGAWLVAFAVGIAAVARFGAGEYGSAGDD